MTIGDYKTTKANNAPTKFTKKYEYQLMCYAWMMKEQGMDINNIELCYIKRYVPGKVSEKTGKTGKAYPITVTTITKEYTDETHAFAGSIIKLVSETMRYFFDNPESAPYLFSDIRISQNINVDEYLGNIEALF